HRTRRDARLLVRLAQRRRPRCFPGGQCATRDSPCAPMMTPVRPVLQEHARIRVPGKEAGGAEPPPEPAPWPVRPAVPRVLGAERAGGRDIETHSFIVSTAARERQPCLDPLPLGLGFVG